MRKRLALAGFPAECDEWALGMIREAEKCSIQDGEFSAVKTDVVFLSSQNNMMLEYAGISSSCSCNPILQDVFVVYQSGIPGLSSS